MEVDVAAYVGAVARTVKRVERDGRMARVVIATRDYDTDIADLWNALTTRERIAGWFMPVEGELKLGGRYQLKGNAGGLVTLCEAPQKLGITWEFGGEISWVTVTLAEKGSKTGLTLEHVAHVKDEFWTQYGPGAVGVGWDMGLLGLALHLKTGAPNNPEESMAWMMSPNGRDFVVASSNSWRDAAIADGEDAQMSTKAGANTIGFYTGTPA